MARKLLDTSVLIRYWSKCRPEALQRVTVQDASNSGKSLTRLVNTDAIVTPVYLEFVAGVMRRSRVEAGASLFRAIQSD